MNEYGMVIIGGGEAGARAAVELRAQGWTDSITIISEEKQLPYERPPLSKQHLQSDDEPAPVVILDQEMLLNQNIQWMSGVKAVQIDRDHHRIVLSDGSELGYKRLLLATGALPRRLKVEGSACDQMKYLRTYKDALSIRKHLTPGKNIVVIGGGFIGLEVAASAISRGCNVTLIEVGPRILMRGVSEEIAGIVEARHRKAGVQFKLGVTIQNIDLMDERAAASGEFRISLADGSIIRCDMVLAGIGAIPETSLAAECGLEIDNGISVSEMLVTSDPDIFAAGDCCSFPHPIFKGRIRLEAYRNATDQGLHVAGNMLKMPEERVPFSIVPWFWSDQYELTLQVTGLPYLGKTTVLRDLGDGNKLYFHVSDNGQLISASAIGLSSVISKEIRLAEMLIEKQAAPDLQHLSDPTIKLKQLMRNLL